MPKVHRGQARELSGQGGDRNKLEGCVPLKWAVPPHSLLQGREPAFPDLLVFQEKQEIWTSM